jgi:hypothetical protein
MPAPLPAALVDRGAEGCFAWVGREPCHTYHGRPNGLRQRQAIYALVKGLGHAVRRNDQAVAKRYRRRLRLATVEKFLLISGQWVVAPMVTLSPKDEGSERYVYRSHRDEPKQQMLELIERVIGLLPS